MLYHVPFFIFGVKHTILNDIIQLFFMPVFFMASGYLSGNILTKQLTTKEWFNFKTYSIMIPFFVVGGINILLNDMMNDSLSLKKNPINELLFADSSRGYWFLLVLFFFKVISIIGKQISQIFHIKNILIIVLIIFVIGEVLSRIIYAVWGMESMIRVYYNLPFYLVAMIIRQDKFFKLEGGDFVCCIHNIYNFRICRCTLFCTYRIPSSY